MRSWPGNQQLRHPLSLPVVLVAAIMAVYYPALLSGIHTMDDPGIISLYSASPPLAQILLPGNGYYYRPLIELSYWLDNCLWGMEPVTMHLESILLHCANTLLVFLLARRTLGAADGAARSIPMLTALLFALHPVNVEAVAWIAGRTDVLLALFVLSACFFWLRWLDELRRQDLCAALLLFVAALLTKETALAAVGVVFLLALAWPGTASTRQRMTVVGMISAPVLLLVGFILLFRSGSSGLGRFISGTDLGAVGGIWDALVALGFYARKLLLPVPLNSAIIEVHSFYGIAGLALLPLLCLAYQRRRTLGVLLGSAALLTLPAVVVAVKQVAWTPFAERYLYLPSAFFVLGLALLIRPACRRWPALVVWLVLPLLAASACFSMQRAMLWKDKYAFAQDAVAKSPGFGSLYNVLGAAFLERGEIDKAADAFASADRLNTRPSMRLPIKANLMSIQLARRDYLGARDFFFKLFKEKQDAPEDFLELLHRSDTARIATLRGEEKVRLAVDLLGTLDLLYNKHSDPFWLYRSGQLALIAGDNAKAAAFFRRTVAAAPADAQYLPAAQIHLKRMGRPQ